MTQTPPMLLASLKDPARCNEELATAVKKTVLEPFQVDPSRPESLLRVSRPSRAEFKARTKALAPLAMRIINQNIDSLKKLKPMSKERPGNNNAAINCLIDSAFYATSALKHMSSYTTLQPLDIEKTTSNLIGRIVDLGEYARALEEIRKFRIHLASIANVSLGSDVRPSKEVDALHPSESPRHGSKGFLTEARGNESPSPLNSPHTRSLLQSDLMRRSTMTAWEEGMLQKYGDLFVFPMDTSINDTTVMLLVLAYQMNLVRCWHDINNGALLRYMPYLLDRPNNFMDWCKHLLKYDTSTAKKQFDQLQRTLFNSASKLPASDDAPLQSYCLQALALKAMLYSESSSLAAVSQRMVRISIAYEKGGDLVKYGTIQKLCSGMLEEMDPDPQNLSALDAYFLLCDYYAFVSRKAKSYKGAFYAFKHMMRPLRDILQNTEKCQYFHTAYAANAKLSLGCVQMDKMVLGNTYADISTTLSEICSCLRMVTASISDSMHFDSFSERALSSLSKSIDGFRVSCSRLYEHIEKSKFSGDESPNIDTDPYSTPPRQVSPPSDDVKWSDILAGMVAVLEKCSEVVPLNVSMMKKRSCSDKPTSGVTVQQVSMSFVDIMILLSKLHFDASKKSTYSQSYEYLASAEQMCSDLGFTSGYRWLSGAYYTMGWPMVMESKFGDAMYPLRKSCTLLEKDHARVKSDEGKLQLSKRYEILGTCCQKNNNFEDSVKAFRLALKRLPVSCIEEFVKESDKLSIAALSAKNGLLPKLIDRFLRSSTLDSDLELFQFASEVMDTSSLDEIEKCAIHECELKVLHAMSVKMDLSKHRSLLVNTLLSHYEAEIYPIRRARVLLDKIRVERTKGLSGTQSALANATEAGELLNTNHYGSDGSLLQYRRHYLAMASSWMAICSRELGEERPKAFNMALHQWGMLLKNVNPMYANAPTPKEDKAHAFSQIDDVDKLYDHLRMLADLFGVNQQLTYQINALRLLLKLDNGLRDVSTDTTSSTVTTLATIGRIYSDLGYSGKAAVEFSHAKKVMQIKTCSGSAELTYLISYASHLARIGNYTKSKQIFDMTKPIWKSLDITTETAPFAAARLHTNKNLILSDSHFTRSLVAAQTECLDTAISDCLMALRIANSCAQSIKRRADARLETSNTSDPFSMDSKTNPISNVASEIAFKESQWSIALRITACLRYLGELNLIRGSWREAKYFLEQGHGLGQQLKSNPLIYRFLLAQSDAHLRCGDLDQCQARLQQAASVQPSKRLYPKEDADMKMLVGCVDSNRHYLTEAIQAFDEANDIFRKMMEPGYIATIEQLVDREDDVDKKLSVARDMHMVEDSIQYECRPLQATQGLNTINKAMVLIQQGSAANALGLLDKLEETGAMANNDIELSAAIAHVRLALARKELGICAEARVLDSDVLVLPPTRLMQASSPTMRRSRMNHQMRLMRDNVTLALERMLDAHRSGWGKSRVKVLHDLCAKSGAMMFLKNYLSTGSRVMVNNYATLAAYYFEMAKGLTIRREMISCLEEKLKPHSSPSSSDRPSWPRPFHEPVKESSPTLSSPTHPPLFENPPWLDRHLHTLHTHYMEEHELDDSEFQERFIDILPEHWTVCSINMDPDSHHLYIVRMRAGETPLEMKLPLHRTEFRGTHHPSLKFADAVTELEDIIRSSDRTIHSGKQVVDQQDVNEWWTTRTRLDRRLKQLLEDMENHWLSGFRGLLSGRYREYEPGMTQFQQSVNHAVYKAICPMDGDVSRLRRLDVGLALCRILVQLGLDSYDRDVEDVAYFLLSCYESQDVSIDMMSIDLGLFKDQLRAALHAYHTEARAAGVDTTARCPNDHVILIPDKYMQRFPLESLATLRPHSVSRLPCLSFLRDRVLYARAQSNDDSWQEVTIDRKRTFYILNPSGDLVHTQKEFESIFGAEKDWVGLVRERPLEHQCHNAMRSKDLYMYFGHSAGQSFIRGQLVRQLPQCSVTLLMGCSSGTLTNLGEYDPHGYVMNYLLGGSPAVVANLWDVTDKSIDQLTRKMMDTWGLFSSTRQPTSLVDAVAASRHHCHLPYLIGAAPVVYGIPVYIAQRAV